MKIIKLVAAFVLFFVFGLVVGIACEIYVLVKRVWGQKVDVDALHKDVLVGIRMMLEKHNNVKMTLDDRNNNTLLH
jgi:hypothetical protein